MQQIVSRGWRLAARLPDCGAETQLDSAALELLCESNAAHFEAAAQVSKLGAVYLERQELGKLPKFNYSPH